MTADLIARAILMAGALLLVLGPGMQARLEMREYHELLAALGEHDLPAETREYLRMLSIGPSMALRSPLGALEFLAGPADWLPLYRAARRAFLNSDGASDERVIQIRTHLTRARNWGIVVLGSVLIFAGSSLEFVHTLATGQAH